MIGLTSIELILYNFFSCSNMKIYTCRWLLTWEISSPFTLIICKIRLGVASADIKTYLNIEFLWIQDSLDYIYRIHIYIYNLSQLKRPIMYMNCTYCIFRQGFEQLQQRVHAGEMSTASVEAQICGISSLQFYENYLS